MWDLNTTTSHSSKSLRRIFTFFLATFVAVFTCAIISTTNTFALDAMWKSSSTITYDGNSYIGPVPEDAVKNLGLATGSKAYTFVDPATVESRKIRVIFFEPNTNTDSIEMASYKTLTYKGAGNYASPSDVTSVAIDSKSKDTASTSCAVDGGLGWIICPVTNFLANSMDWIFDIIKSFMIVRPVSSDQSSALYRAWSYMRSFANVAFVIGFLVIIYSQITSYGISNYGVKKLLPRLIIAAILVNISYFVCALAVDISNVLGASLQQVFISMRNGVVGTSGNSWDLVNFNSITGFILSGGTAAAAGTVAILGTLSVYGVGYSIALLFPTLLIGFMAVLVALAVMAARQALVTILIVLSPLAFVAYLLPNTEKWFEKWKSTFYTMLILFPAFSVIFGGSQLAASLIIQNADSINTVILGLIIQVVPLFLTPFLIKMSGSIVGKVAGFVNNPSKGPIDGTRKFIQDRADVNAAKRLGQDPKPYQFLRKHAQRVDHGRRRRDGWKSSYGTMTDARWAKSGTFSDIDQNTREYQEVKSLGEATSELRYSQSRVTSGRLQQVDVQIRETKLLNDSARIKSDLNWEQNRTDGIREARFSNNLLGDRLNLEKAVNANDYQLLKSQKFADLNFKSNSEGMREILETARSTAEALSIQSMRKAFIDQNLNVDFADALQKSSAKSAVAGAAEINKNGAANALAAAISIVDNDNTKDVKNRSTLMSFFNVSSTDFQAISLKGKTLVDKDGERILNERGQPIIEKVAPIIGKTKTADGTEIEFTFNPDDDLNTEAAIARQLKYGIYNEYRDIMESSGKGGALEKFASSIGSGAAASGIGDKAPFMGGKAYGDAGQGLYTGHNSTLKYAADWIGDGKFSAEKIAGYDKAVLEEILKAINLAKAGKLYNPATEFKNIEKFKKSLPTFLNRAYQILDQSNTVGSHATSGACEVLEKLLLTNSRQLPPPPSNDMQD